MTKILERISQHSFLPEFVPRGARVLDLGGNRGEFTVPMSLRYGCVVTAVEPVPQLAGDLKARGIDVIQAAITGYDGEVALTYDMDKELTGSVMDLAVVGGLLDATGSRTTTLVKAVSLDSILTQTGPVRLLKVDIEGAELDMIMETSADTLRSVDQITVEFHDFWYPELRDRTEEAKQRLMDIGFHMIRFTPNNKDVLFINKRLPFPAWKRLYISKWLRNINGLWRAGRVGMTAVSSRLGRWRADIQERPSTA
jgi:FkbM family methyltransferase